jgi:hypothetical protein
MEKHPPEQATDKSQWLCMLRRKVILRNSKAPDVNRLDKLVVNLAVTDQEMIKRFNKRFVIPSFWIYDVFLFLAFVAMTLDWKSIQSVQTWTQLLACIDRLSPITLHLSTTTNLLIPTNLNEALASLAQSPTCPTNILIPTIAATHIKIKS